MPAQPARGQRSLQLGTELVEIPGAALRGGSVSRLASNVPSVARSCSKSSMASAGSRGAGHARVDRPSLKRARAQVAGVGHAAFDRPDRRRARRTTGTRGRDSFISMRGNDRYIALGRGADRQLEVQPLVAAALVQPRQPRAAATWRAARRAAARPRECAAETGVRPGPARRRRGRRVRARRAACRRTRGRGAGAAVRASASRAGCESTSRTSRRPTGPTVASGASSFSTRRTRAGSRSTSGHQRVQRREPLAPELRRRPVGHRCSTGSAKADSASSCAASRRKARARGEIRLVRLQLANAAVVLAAEPRQSIAPARHPVDDVRLDDQLLPSPRRAQRARHRVRRFSQPDATGALHLPAARSSARSSGDDERLGAPRRSACVHALVGSARPPSAPGPATRIPRTGVPRDLLPRRR